MTTPAEEFGSAAAGTLAVASGSLVKRSFGS
jgi:hypothetical protein